MSARSVQVISTVIEQTGVYHKRSGLMVAVVALLACIGVVMVEPPLSKGVLLAFGVGFGVMAWRLVRLANRYFDPAVSPVLHAIVHDRSHIKLVRSQASSTKNVAMVIVEDDAGHRLDLRVPHGESAPELTELLDAFAELIPAAEVRRTG